MSMKIPAQGYELKIKRVYEDSSDEDGYRILVDRIWPRGISKERAKIDVWEKEVAPSTELRKRFNHISSRYAEFVKMYEEELSANCECSNFLEKCMTYLKHSNVTFVYGTKSETENNAKVLRDWALMNSML